MLKIWVMQCFACKLDWTNSKMTARPLDINFFANSTAARFKILIFSLNRRFSLIRDHSLSEKTLVLLGLA